MFGIGQVLEGFVLTPWLVGDRIGLHPVAVIFSVLAGGQLFGFVGVLLGLPLAAVIMVLLRHGHERYIGSRLYGKENDISLTNKPSTNKDETPDHPLTEHKQDSTDNQADETS